MSSLILPSILNADFTQLQEQIFSVVNAGASWLHMDIMDGNFVPNISFGPSIQKQIRNITDAHFDTHLMLANPDLFIEPFIEAGSQSITVHAELGESIFPILEKIRNTGCKCGISLNPDTPLTTVEPYLSEIDLLLIMSVVPGFGGQEFIPKVFGKLWQAANMIQERGLSVTVEVDGGINKQNLKKVIGTGVDWIVIGSGIFKATDPGEAYQRFAAGIRQNDV